jgi:hypothetical protein
MQIVLNSAGMHLPAGDRFVVKDENIATRTSIFSLIAVRADAQVLSSTGRDFEELERQELAQLAHNQPSHSRAPIVIPHFLSHATGQLVVGTRYSEIVPSWRHTRASF